MSTLKEQYITSALEKISALDEADLEKMSEKHIADQVTFFSYLISSSIEFENDNILDLIVFYFNVLFEAALLQGIDTKTIDDDFIDSFQDEYTQTLNEYMDNNDNDLIETLCNQPPLLDFMIGEITGVDEAGDHLPEKMQTELFVVSIAMIALFNRAIIK